MSRMISFFSSAKLDTIHDVLKQLQVTKMVIEEVDPVMDAGVRTPAKKRKIFKQAKKMRKRVKGKIVIAGKKEPAMPDISLLFHPGKMGRQKIDIEQTLKENKLTIDDIRRSKPKRGMNLDRLKLAIAQRGW